MRFKRPSAAWLVAVTALVLAVGTGSAVGARLITGKDIKNSSITGRDIKNRSLTASDVSSSAKQAFTGKQGAPGPAGTPGPVGPPGPPGPSQLSPITRIEQQGSVAAGQLQGVTATCPSGQGLVSGGFRSAGAGEVFGNDSFASTNSWTMLYDNSNSTVSADIRAIVYCAASGQAASPRSASHVDADIAEAIAAQRAKDQR